LIQTARLAIKHTFLDKLSRLYSSAVVSPFQTCKIELH